MVLVTCGVLYRTLSRTSLCKVVFNRFRKRSRTWRNINFQTKRRKGLKSPKKKNNKKKKNSGNIKAKKINKLPNLCCGMVKMYIIHFSTFPSLAQKCCKCRSCRFCHLCTKYDFVTCTKYRSWPPTFLHLCFSLHHHYITTPSSRKT